MEQIPPDFREEEQDQAIEAFAESLLDHLENEAKIDGMPTPKGEPSGFDPPAVYFDREAARKVIKAKFLEAWQKIEEIRRD
jgi:hypothetical protein